ncbi:hypothetical protein [Muribaculum intestinale]|uniref:WDGH domain-containing protein n=1 Tax=Muribaculum intestinale TaxID=1796646 RepID=UPI0025B63486|nr:hypothetical protein [Muribaculum intestinale]
MSKTIKEINEAIKSLHPKEGQVSDGYHTFDELYDFRRAYNAALVNTHVYPCIKSHRHSDGELCFGGGWFIVQMNLPTGQISNHYEDKYWGEFDCKEQECAEPWDGHTESDVLARLTELNQNSYRMPLSQRLTDEERERVRKLYIDANDKLKICLNAINYNQIAELDNECKKGINMGLILALKYIFGKELFGEGEG